MSFKTLARSKKFQARFDGRLIRIRTSNGKYDWRIRKSEMKQAWNKARSVNQERRFSPSTYQEGTIRTSSYIAALLKNFM